MKQLLLLGLAMLLMVSCKKTEDETPAPAKPQSVFKQAARVYYNCKLSARLVIEGDTIDDDGSNSGLDTMGLAFDPLDSTKILFQLNGYTLFYGHQVELIGNGFVFQIPRQYAEAMEVDMVGIKANTFNSVPCDGYYSNGAVYIKTQMISPVFPDIEIYYTWLLK